MKKIGVLLVHGVGEQTRFEHLEAIACNLYRALANDDKRKERAYIQIRRGDQVPRHSPEESWREAPALVRWTIPGQNEEDIEVRFREVHWADLDLPFSWRRWLSLAAWSLGMAGVRTFEKSGHLGSTGSHNMRLPEKLRFWQKAKVRLQLLLASLAFFFMLITVDLTYLALKRLSARAHWLGKLRGLIYNYLGDVKLYQDRCQRKDDSLEALGEKSRAAIRRRAVRAIVQTASETEKKELDGFYIFAHSLGTVVALNALMEPAVALPNYLTEEEWQNLPATLRQRVEGIPGRQMPRRPPWLKDCDTDEKKPLNAIDRRGLFGHMRGFLTMGSPLDKFAAIWRRIVPINKEPVPDNVSWINVADAQDIVAGNIDLLDKFAPESKGVGKQESKDVGGLRLDNVEWADQWTLFSAHTSYWQAKNGKDRLVNRLIPWLEGGDFQAPEHSISPPVLARLIFWATLIALGGLLLWVPAILTSLFSGTSLSVIQLMVCWLGFGVVVVLIFSGMRWMIEGCRCGDPSDREE